MGIVATMFARYPKIIDFSCGFQSYLPAGTCSRARRDRSISRLISANKNSVNLILAPHRNDLLRTVLVMPPPPLIRLRLRPTFRRVFPGLLTSQYGQVEKRPWAAEHLHAATVRVVVAIGDIAVAEKGTQAEGLSLLCRQ